MAIAGVAARGTAWARWKKFHLLDGLGCSFSALFFFDGLSQLPSLLSAVTSLVEFLRVLDAERAAGAAGPLGPCAVCKARDVRFEVSAGKKDLFESSSLSEGLRSPMVIFFIGDPPRMVSGIADGNSVGRFFSIAVCDMLFVVFFSSAPGRTETSRLLVLCMGSGLRENSELLPVPRITTGASRLTKKSSISALVVLVILLLRVEGVWSKLSDVVPALADRPMLVPLAELPLRPLTAYFP